MRILARGTFHQNALHRTHARAADRAHVLFKRCLQLLQAAQLDVVWCVVVQIGGRSTGAWAEDETEASVVAHVLDQLHHLGEVVLGFSGESDNEVAGQAQIGPHCPQLANNALVLHRGVATLHRRKDAIAAVLHRQVQMTNQLRNLGIHIDQCLGEFIGVAGGIADAFNARNFGDIFNQQRQIRDFVTVAHLAPVGVHVLAQQGDFFHPLVGQAGDLHQHLLERTTEFLATGVGHYAIAAIFAAPFHDRDEGRGTLHPRWRQVIKFFNLGEADVHLRLLPGRAFIEQLRQTVQRLWAKHHIYKRRALDDLGAFLTGHAAAHTNFDTASLEMFDAPQIAEHFLLCFFAHRARVEKNQICLFGIVSFLVSLGSAQHISHFARVILVHLAAKGFDEDFFAGIFRSVGGHGNHCINQNHCLFLRYRYRRRQSAAANGNRQEKAAGTRYFSICIGADCRKAVADRFFRWPDHTHPCAATARAFVWVRADLLRNLTRARCPQSVASHPAGTSPEPRAL